MTAEERKAAEEQEKRNREIVEIYKREQARKAAEKEKTQ